jgi:hypothetical protein
MTSNTTHYKTKHYETKWLDNFTVTTRISIPIHSIVYFQACFESYEGIGIVRTIDKEQGIIEIIATKDTYKECTKLIDQIMKEIVPR